MPELTDAQKVLRNDTGKRMAAALEALAGTGGRGLPAGGTDGDVLVKKGAVDYVGEWTPTPPQMGSLATIEPTSSASKAYAAGDYLVYNGQLYKATGTISPDETLTPGGNIEATDTATAIKDSIAVNNTQTTILISAIDSSSRYAGRTGNVLLVKGWFHTTSNIPSSTPFIDIGLVPKNSLCYGILHKNPGPTYLIQLNGASGFVNSPLDANSYYNFCIIAFV
jgi:hypothetical protein